MGSSIPSFRQLVEIERLNWSEFKKKLSFKNDRQAFDLIFENASHKMMKWICEPHTQSFQRFLHYFPLLV